MCLVDDGLDMPSSIYDSILGENIMNIVREFFVDKMTGFVTFFSANNEHKMFTCRYVCKVMKYPDF